MKSIENIDLHDRRDRFALKALLRSFKEICGVSLRSACRRKTSQYKNCQDPLKSLYEKCTHSRKTHTSESFYQNMGYWNGDAGFPIGNAEKSKLIMHYIIAYTFLMSDKNNWNEILKPSDLSQIKLSIKGLYNSTGNIKKGCGKAILIDSVVNYRLNYILTDVAEKAKELYNQISTKDKIDDYKTSLKYSDDLVETIKMVSKDPAFYKKLPL